MDNDKDELQTCTIRHNGGSSAINNYYDYANGDQSDVILDPTPLADLSTTTQDLNENWKTFLRSILLVLVYAIILLIISWRSQTYQDLEPLTQKLCQYIGGLFLFCAPPISYHFLGSYRQGSQWRWFQPLVGGARFIILQAIGWSLYAFCLCGIIILVYIGVANVSHLFLTSLGAVGIAAQLLLVLSVQYFTKPTTTTPIFDQYRLRKQLLRKIRQQRGKTYHQVKREMDEHQGNGPLLGWFGVSVVGFLLSLLSLIAAIMIEIILQNEASPYDNILLPFLSTIAILSLIISVPLTHALAGHRLHNLDRYQRPKYRRRGAHGGSRCIGPDCTDLREIWFINHFFSKLLTSAEHIIDKRSGNSSPTSFYDEHDDDDGDGDGDDGENECDDGHDSLHLKDSPDHIADDHIYRWFQPLKGGAQYVFLQFLGWSLYGLALVIAIFFTFYADPVQYKGSITIGGFITLTAQLLILGSLKFFDGDITHRIRRWGEHTSDSSTPATTLKDQIRNYIPIGIELDLNDPTLAQYADIIQLDPSQFCGTYFPHIAKQRELHRQRLELHSSTAGGDISSGPSSIDQGKGYSPQKRRQRTFYEQLKTTIVDITLVALLFHTPAFGAIFIIIPLLTILYCGLTHPVSITILIAKISYYSFYSSSIHIIGNSSLKYFRRKRTRLWIALHNYFQAKVYTGIHEDLLQSQQLCREALYAISKMPLPPPDHNSVALEVVNQKHTSTSTSISSSNPDTMGHASLSAVTSSTTISPPSLPDHMVENNNNNNNNPSTITTSSIGSNTNSSDIDISNHPYSWILSDDMHPSSLNNRHHAKPFTHPDLIIANTQLNLHPKVPMDLIAYLKQHLSDESPSLPPQQTTSDGNDSRNMDNNDNDNNNEQSSRQPLLFPTLATSFMFGFSPHGIYPMTSIWSTKVPEFHVFDERLKRFIDDDHTLRHQYLCLRNHYLLLKRNKFCKKHNITIAQFRYASSLYHSSWYPASYQQYYESFTLEDIAIVDSTHIPLLLTKWWFNFPLWEHPDDIIDDTNQLLFTYQNPNDNTTPGAISMPTMTSSKSTMTDVIDDDQKMISHHNINSNHMDDNTNHINPPHNIEASSSNNNNNNNNNEDDLILPHSGNDNPTPLGSTHVAIDSPNRIKICEMEDMLIMKLQLPRFEELTPRYTSNPSTLLPETLQAFRLKHSRFFYESDNAMSDIANTLSLNDQDNQLMQKDTHQTIFHSLHTSIKRSLKSYLPQFCNIYLPTQVDTFAASVIPFTPVLREIFLWTGGRDVSRESILCCAAQNRSVLLVPGGQREMPYSSDKDFDFVLYTHHQGFVRMAMRCGMPLVPIFSFGENQIVSTFQLPAIQMFIYRQTRVYLPIFPHGPFYTMVPNRVPVTVVVGQPIFMPVIDNPSQEIVKFYHALYYVSVAKLFFRYRASAGLPTSKLTFM